MLAYFDWLISSSIFANVRCAEAYDQTFTYHTRSLKFYRDNEDFVRECLCECLDEYYALFPVKSAKGRCSKVKATTVDDESFMSLEDLKAIKASRRESAGQG